MVLTKSSYCTPKKYNHITRITESIGFKAQGKIKGLLVRKEAKQELKRSKTNTFYNSNTQLIKLICLLILAVTED